MTKIRLVDMMFHHLPDMFRTTKILGVVGRLLWLGLYALIPGCLGSHHPHAKETDRSLVSGRAFYDAEGYFRTPS